MSAKVDAEFADHDLRHAHQELDRLLGEIRRDADFLEENGQYAGATLMRRNASLIEGELDRLRKAQDTLARLTSVTF